MPVIQLMSIEIEARRLIARARRISRQAARDRGERPASRLCRHRMTVYALRGLVVTGLAADLYGMYRFGWL